MQNLSMHSAAFATIGGGDSFSVRTFCQTFGLKQDCFTRLIGFSPRAVAHWASGQRPGGSAHKRFREITRLFEALAKLVDVDAIGSWLNRANSALDGSTPLQVIERGETDRIWRIIWNLQSGNSG